MKLDLNSHLKETDTKGFSDEKLLVEFTRKFKMFRQSVLKILSGNSLIRFSFSSAANDSYKALRHRRKQSKIIVKQIQSLTPPAHVDLTPLMSQLSKVKRFELKIVTTTFYLKVDNSSGRRWTLCDLMQKVGKSGCQFLKQNIIVRVRVANQSWLKSETLLKS